MRMLERVMHEEDGAATAEYVIATMATVGALERTWPGVSRRVAPAVR